MEKILDALQHVSSPTWLSLGAYESDVESGLRELDQVRAARRIWARDGTFWKQDASAVAEIENRLGWLDLPREMLVDVLRLKALAAEVRAAGIFRIVLVGMGGSSLAPEVMRAVLGVAPGHPGLAVLDTTDPAQIRRAETGGSAARTLFVVSSKWGTTAETMNLYQYFKARVLEEVGEGEWAEHFVAITDPGTPLEKAARAEGFRAVYLNPPDVGGRYSALSLFGLVPAALIGVDLDRLLHRAKDMAWACRATAPAEENPGMVLGTVMGKLACHPSQPRDKLTLVASPQLTPLGPWVEQLVAESTGKEGRGILPVLEDSLGKLARYGPDRLLAYLRLDGADNDETDVRVARLAMEGHPIIVLRVADLYDLGGEFFRWEMATAIAGKILGVNPFDQPDVESAKVQALGALAHYEETHALPKEPAVLDDGELQVYGREYEADSVSEYLKLFLDQAKPGDYVALMAYVDRDAANETLLQAMRRVLERESGLAVTTGFGPRFLHSTGQLHKGGPNNGLFLQITHEEERDLAIPDRAYSFGVLKRAQALGDLQALRTAGRRVVRIHVGSSAEIGLQRLVRAVRSAVRTEQSQ